MNCHRLGPEGPFHTTIFDSNVAACGCGLAGTVVHFCFIRSLHNRYGERQEREKVNKDFKPSDFSGWLSGCCCCTLFCFVLIILSVVIVAVSSYEIPPAYRNVSNVVLVN